MSKAPVPVNVVPVVTAPAVGVAPPAARPVVPTFVYTPPPGAAVVTKNVDPVSMPYNVVAVAKAVLTALLLVYAESVIAGVVAPLLKLVWTSAVTISISILIL